MYRRIGGVAAAALAAAAVIGLGACSKSDPDAITVTMTCSPGGLHRGLMTVTGASCPVSPPGSEVYYAALKWASLPASAAAQLNATPTTIKCTTKDKSRTGRVGASFNESEQTHFFSWWTSSDITFTSGDEAVVCVMTSPVFAAQGPGTGLPLPLLLGGVWPPGTPVKTETYTCDSTQDHGILTEAGNFCNGGEPTARDIRATRLLGWNAGGEDQLNGTTTTITCTTQDPSGARFGDYGGASHANSSPDITFTNALGTVCVLTNPAITSLTVDPTRLVLRI
jgi:hypothetical protein